MVKKGLPLLYTHTNMRAYKLFRTCVLTDHYIVQERQLSERQLSECVYVCLFLLMFRFEFSGVFLLLLLLQERGQIERQAHSTWTKAKVVKIHNKMLM